MDRGKIFGIFLMLIMVIIAGCAQQQQAPNNDTETNQTPADTTNVTIQNEFDNKIVYTTDRTQDQSMYVNHCEQRGGTFNECGTICPPGSDMCAQVCAWTCDLTGDEGNDSDKPVESQVPIRDEFEDKIVYGSSPDANESTLRAHCAEQGGDFNTCGSVCPSDADTCIEVCAYTCELN